MRLAAWFLGLAVAGPVMLGSAQTQSGATPGRLPEVSTKVRCAASLGMGAKSHRQFCDIMITSTGAESISLEIPAHAGPSTLRFDLHNRFVAAAEADAPAHAFTRHASLVAIVGADGTVVGRAAVTREFRTIQDLFDRIGGGAHPGGVKAVAPGPAEAVTITIPADLAAIGIVGVSIEERTAAGTATWTTRGRPVALASNFRIEYTPQ